MDIPASPPSFSFPRITRRRRHTNTGQAPSSPQPPPANQGPIAIEPLEQPTSSSVQAPSRSAAQENGRAFRIRLVPHLESNRSLHFDPIVRDVKLGGAPLRVGRFTDRATNPSRGNGLNPNDRNSDKVAFRSKVVSRAHAELWVEEPGKFFLKDTKSSSGTFINHMRLSPPGQESLAHLLKDGDVIQLGVDYQGGTEEMYRCVKIKVEVGQGREWQGGANAFNTAALKQLRTLQAGDIDLSRPKTVGDCCICLFGVGVCQSLFIAPCSHAFHYKCIRPMLELHHPGFSCPLCRTFADLEADVEIESSPQHAMVQEGSPDDEEEHQANHILGHVVDSRNLPNPSHGDAPEPMYIVDSDNDAVMNSPGNGGRGGSSRNITGRLGSISTPAQRQIGTRSNPFASPVPQPGPPNITDDDVQVENALLDYHVGDDDEAMGLGGVIENNRTHAEFGGLGNGPRRFATDTAGRRSAGASVSNSRPIPPRIDSSRRLVDPSESDREREARDFADAATPLNNTFIALANNLHTTVEQSGPPANQGLSTSHMGHRGNFANIDEDYVELELDEGTDGDDANNLARERGSSSRSGSGSGNNVAGSATVAGGGGGASSAATTPPGVGSIIGVSGAKRKRSL